MWNLSSLISIVVISLRFASFPVLLTAVPVEARTGLPCPSFTSRAPASPEPHDLPRFNEINAAIKTQRYRVLFFGDSLTYGFNTEVWREHMQPRGVLNAGVSGDRTDQLLWRMQHGNLDGPPPRAVILLIGSNDLAQGRTPEASAEGIRAKLLELRRRRPRAGILLLGLWPREDVPRIVERHEIAAVNALITKCADDRIRYADLGGALLETDGRLSPEISFDQVHFTAQGYARVAPTLDRLIDELTAR